MKPFLLSLCVLCAFVVNAPAASLTLNWSDNADNETGFIVERADVDELGAPIAWSEIIRLGADVETFKDLSLEYSTTYAYRVRAYNIAGVSAATNEASGTTEAAPLPELPTAPTGATVTITVATTGDAEVMVATTPPAP